MGFGDLAWWMIDRQLTHYYLPLHASRFTDIRQAASKIKPRILIVFRVWRE